MEGSQKQVFVLQPNEYLREKAGRGLVIVGLEVPSLPSLPKPAVPRPHHPQDRRHGISPLR